MTSDGSYRPVTGSDAGSTQEGTKVLAADVGGTRSRVLIAPAAAPSAAEEPTSRPEPYLGPGANIRSSGPEALDDLAETVTRAARAGGIAPDHIAGIALGLAGAGPARHDEIEAGMRERLAARGFDPSRVTVGDDQITAFLSADVGDDGVLLLAGTGAVGVRYEQRRRVRVSDGMGWLLGDVGSAVWLGRRTLEAVAADVDSRGPHTRLTEALGTELGLDLREGEGSPTGDVRQDLIRALDGCSPAQLGRFAPLPATVPADDVARSILDGAERHFTQVIGRLDPEIALPVVLAGSVLASDGPIHDELIDWMEAAGRTVRIVPDGLAGALRLAREAASGGPR
jgi:glucosamine kinase